MLAGRLRTIAACTLVDQDPALAHAELRRGRRLLSGLDIPTADSEVRFGLAVCDAWEEKFVDDILSRTSEALRQLVWKCSGCSSGGCARRSCSQRPPGSVAETPSSSASCRTRTVLEAPRSVGNAPLRCPFFEGTPDFLRGQVAAAQGDRERALYPLREASARIPRAQMLSIHARKRCGDLLDGAEGARIRSKALPELCGRGIRNLARWVALFAPELQR